MRETEQTVETIYTVRGPDDNGNYVVFDYSGYCKGDFRGDEETQQMNPAIREAIRKHKESAPPDPVEIDGWLVARTKNYKAAASLPVDRDGIRKGWEWVGINSVEEGRNRVEEYAKDRNPAFRKYVEPTLACIKFLERQQ